MFWLVMVNHPLKKGGDGSTVTAVVGVRDSLEEALPGENSRNAHQAGQNGHRSHHVAGLGNVIQAGVLTAGGAAAGSVGHLVVTAVAFAAGQTVGIRIITAVSNAVIYSKRCSEFYNFCFRSNYI